MQQNQVYDHRHYHSTSKRFLPITLQTCGTEEIQKKERKRNLPSIKVQTRKKKALQYPCDNHKIGYRNEAFWHTREGTGGHRGKKYQKNLRQNWCGNVEMEATPTRSASLTTSFPSLKTTFMLCLGGAGAPPASDRAFLFLLAASAALSLTAFSCVRVVDRGEFEPERRKGRWDEIGTYVRCLGKELSVRENMHAAPAECFGCSCFCSELLVVVCCRRCHPSCRCCSWRCHCYFNHLNTPMFAV